MVTEGVVQGVYKVVIWSSFCVKSDIRQMEVLGSFWHEVTYESRTVVERRVFCQMCITTNYTACSENNSDEMGRPWRWFLRRGIPVTTECSACSVKGVLNSNAGIQFVR